MIRSFKAASEVRDFTEYRYKSTLERELSLAVCRLWNLAAAEGASDVLGKALDGLDPALLEALRQALRLVRREQAMDAPMGEAEVGAQSPSAAGGRALTGEGEAETDAEAALATLPWDEGASSWQLEDLEAQLTNLGFGMISRDSP